MQLCFVRAALGDLSGKCCFMCCGQTAGWALAVQLEGLRFYLLLFRLKNIHNEYQKLFTVGTICTAQWSLYVPHSGHFMYRTVVTLCTAQWSLYVPPGSTFRNSTFCPHSMYLCVLCGSQNKQLLFPYTALTDWFL